ncbi:MAG TPA: hypothetical protein VN130_11150, partial [Xanthobacteraceae bacterium]|nr:hypothetical protein [Xanthobacteraceae bacterium]
MTRPRLATFTAQGATNGATNGATRYGAVTDAGIVDLSAHFGQIFPTLREAIAADALMKLADDAAGRS